MGFWLVPKGCRGGTNAAIWDVVEIHNRSKSERTFVQDRSTSANICPTLIDVGDRHVVKFEEIQSNTEVRNEKSGDWKLETEICYVLQWTVNVFKVRSVQIR